MPTYVYRCPKGHEFELFQKMSDEPGAACPTCGKPAERQFSPGGGFLFKGDGFYITDYRSADYRKKADAEGGAGGSAKGSDKPAKDAPAKPAQAEKAGGGTPAPE
jgi:putative FmdB family regulatory protein